jgi:hypothetical protein
MASSLIDAPDAVPVHTGMLWAIKRSFLGYVRRLPDGAISISDEMGLTPGTEFHFPLHDVKLHDDLTGVIRFRGAVRLSGHQGMLAVNLADPWLHLETEAASLSFNLAGKDAAEARAEIFQMRTLPPVLDGDMCEWSAMQPTLASVGVAMFGSYPAGTTFDPLSVRVPSPQRR